MSALPVPVEVPDADLKRWHPTFKIDSLPHIEESDLPQPPMASTASTAQDVLNVARDKIPQRVGLHQHTFRGRNR